MANVPSRSPSFPQVMSEAIDNAMAEVQTAIPGVVKSYDAEKQLVDVQPLVQQLYLTEEGELAAQSFPVIKSVPVVFPGANGFRITFPISEGATVLLIFANRSIDRWKSNGGEVDPQDTRRFHVADAIAVPGLNPNTTPWTGAATDAMTMGKDGGVQLVFRDGKIELGGDAANPPSDALALASKCMDGLNALANWAGSMASTFDQHKHPVAGIQTAGSPVAHTQTAPVNSQAPSGSAPSKPTIDEVKSAIVLAK